MGLRSSLPGSPLERLARTQALIGIVCDAVPGALRLVAPRWMARECRLRGVGDALAVSVRRKGGAREPAAARTLPRPSRPPHTPPRPSSRPPRLPVDADADGPMALSLQDVGIPSVCTARADD